MIQIKKILSQQICREKECKFNIVISTKGRNLFPNIVKDFSLEDSFEMTSDYLFKILLRENNSLFILSIFIFLLLNVGCRCPSEIEMKIPHNVIEKSNQQIIAMTGEQFFISNFMIEFER